MSLNAAVSAVTDRVIERSKPGRQAYLDLIAHEAETAVRRPNLGCANLAHAYAGTEEDRDAMKADRGMNIGIVSAYNDMLSAHAVYYRYPELMKVWAREVGATAQVAGGVPAMCDGVTQGYAGMELSLFSRDTIALSTAVALSHGTFEGAALLGICDKIVPGLLMGALRFGHLPMILVPGGPMPTGLPNKQKAAVREAYAEGKAGRGELLDAEIAAYHSKGTCTFYGTANTNQMMMEVMGLHMPGAAFVNPGTKLRQELSRAAVHRLAKIGQQGEDYRPLGRCVDEKAIVNAAVGLLATGGSTNHLIHLPAIARAAGIIIDWEDMDRLSAAVPLIARVYPNGSADVNGFEAAGGMPYVIRELLSAGLLHRDILTVAGKDLSDYGQTAVIADDKLSWTPVGDSGDETILRPASAPFSPDGGMRILSGNLGRACIKVSAVERERWIIEAPARVFSDQSEVQAAFKAGELERDVVVVVRFQGPKANGMPELHKLTPPLGVLQNRGFKVALVTDGRMSGASGKVPCAIHLSPEAIGGGAIGLIRDGDIVRLDAVAGTLNALVDPAEWATRKQAETPAPVQGMGRELFALFRQAADEAERGASPILAGAGL
ncbi:phosphogluconate dehydratase [Sphingomonas sp. S17]|jgi:phosphogluconate dehydratase|uniref:Phosphogluconate dehydratase n=3 Tax=Bacteria TaxID=2 RepID=A0A411LEZ8_SPHPI|nr:MULTISPECIES: phosphogluconate dehydratase [Sphingomonas]EGI56892.1 phosphogluconate dehydratase [Sphingomonas sp. S17]MBQ1480188.1 phosphogluconate dehydratase [Sphingomonas sp.]MCM3678909.1 phosphogluconate dehydratase [Sphingomonas paucimobilis]MDG5971661.1 phosphogluconate dehydratase [Sphingomonas paucimobilis]NNG58325.1 phosphogluconate dehydratase [Sphingomonas paucimobilis]